MAQSKGTKRSLLTSFLCILLSLSMLISSTFAWFTDRVSTKNNIITSGNLDLEMYWTDDPSTDTWYNVEEEGYNTIFSYENWEPGYTDVKYIKIVNKGDLALNYDLSIEAQGAVGKLAEVINVYFGINDDKLNLRSDLDQLSCIGLLNNVMNGGSQASGTLLPAGTTSLFHNSGEVIVTLAMQMVTTAGNEYQNESSGEFTIKALATQAPWERDSFGSDYDSTAEMPVVLVPTNITVPVTPTAEGTVGAEGLEIVGPNAAAYLPEGVKLVDGATEATLKITPKDSSDSGLSTVNDEILIPVDVHIDGVAEDNTVPIIIDLGRILPKYLNMGNYKLVHVEDGVNEIMTQVSSSDLLTEHNQFTYDSSTGEVTVCMASFSEVTALADTANKWQGGVDYSWFYNWTYRDADPKRRTYTLTNADQLYGFARIVGKMLSADEWNKIPEVREDFETDNSTYTDANGINILDMGFNGHTVQLLNDVDLGGTDVKRDADDKKVVFYPIGYYNSTRENSPTNIVYDRVDGTVTELTVTSSFAPFRGTFNGNGHTISNLYQNTWEMFGDYNSGYSGNPNYYKDGMGLFGWLYGATIYNINVDHFESDGEFTPTGIIAAFAEAAWDDNDKGATTIQGVTITNSNPRVYNTGNGGIVGIGGREENVYAKVGDAECKLTFQNITVDQSNKISALWGSWDVGCGGIMGMFQGRGHVEFINCHVAAQIDVYNDVCGNYQYYWYRYAGMMIGTIYNDTVDVNGYTIPDTTGITATNCTVRFDEWNDYYYCELVANSLASYTHDHQFSRLDEVQSVDVDNMTYVDLKGQSHSIPKSGRYNYVVADQVNRSTENAKCFHFVDGKVHDHDSMGTETEPGTGNTVMVEDKQHIYLPFNQLFQGYGWGVKHIPIYDESNFPGITIQKREDFAKEKFEAKYETSYEKPLKMPVGVELKGGDLFTLKDGAELKGVSIYMEKIVSEDQIERLAIASQGSWSTRKVLYGEAITYNKTEYAPTNKEAGIYRVTIQDYSYCLPTTIYVELVNANVEKECEHCNKTVTFELWRPGALVSKHYYLLDNVTAYAPITVAAGADAVLDLNGHTMTFPESAAVDVGENQTLSVVDSGTTGKIIGFGDEDGLLKVSGGNLNLYDGDYSYSSEVATINDDEEQVSTKGIIWAANPETEASNVKTKVLFTDKVTIPAEAQIFLAAEAEMELKGKICGVGSNGNGYSQIRLIELESGAKLNIQNMQGSSQWPIEIKASDVFAYMESNSGDEQNLMETRKSWFKAGFVGEIDFAGQMELIAKVDISASIKEAFERGTLVKGHQASADTMQELIDNNSCPMCDEEDVRWVPYNSKDHALVAGGTKLHIYFDSSNSGTKDEPIKGGNLIGSYKGNSEICVMLKDTNVFTDGRFLVNPNNTLNIMGKGTVHSNGTYGVGMFTILGKNPTVNIYGGTYTYSGSYRHNDDSSNPGYALIYAESKSAVVNIYNDVTIGYSESQLDAKEPDERENYNVNMYGTLNMYGGTIQNGISAHVWHSGNVTLSASGTLNMYDGLITGGQTPYRGGNVLMRSYSTLNMGYSEEITGVDMSPAIADGKAVFDDAVYQAELRLLREKWKKENPDEPTEGQPTIDDVRTIPGGGNIGTLEATGYLTFNMYQGSITNGVVDSNGAAATSYRSGYQVYMGGGNFYIYGGYSNKVLLQGGTISGGQAYAGGNIYMRNGAKIVVDGATIQDGEATEQGGNINVFNGAELTLESGTISGGSARLGGNINLGQTAGKNAAANITGGVIKNGQATYRGGNIYIAGASKMDFSSGTISGGQATDRGGNIDICGTSIVNISGGTIHSGVTDGNNRYGENIHIHCTQDAKPTVTISGGTIAGSVLLQASSADASGVTHSPILILKGSPIIKNQIEGIEAVGHNGLWVSVDAVIEDISGLTDGAQIDIYKGNTNPFASSDNAQAIFTAGYFKSCRAGYVVQCEENVLKLVSSAS